MTRQRKEILKKMQELDKELAGEIRMAGEYSDELFGAFAPRRYELDSQLAATYDMTVAEYESNLMEYLF